MNFKSYFRCELSLSPMFNLEIRNKAKITPKTGKRGWDWG